jgi:hypothetical protein
MAKTKKPKQRHQSPAAVELDAPASAASNGVRASLAPMSRKEFERKLKPLHVELVKLQLWAQQTGQSGAPDRALPSTHR